MLDVIGVMSRRVGQWMNSRTNHLKNYKAYLETLPSEDVVLKLGIVTNAVITCMEIHMENELKCRVESLKILLFSDKDDSSVSAFERLERLNNCKEISVLVKLRELCSPYTYTDKCHTFLVFINYVWRLIPHDHNLLVKAFDTVLQQMNLSKTFAVQNSTAFVRSSSSSVP